MLSLAYKDDYDGLPPRFVAPLPKVTTTGLSGQVDHLGHLGLDSLGKRSYLPGMSRLLSRYWGFLALAVAIAGWVGLALGHIATSFVALILILSVGALV